MSKRMRRLVGIAALVPVATIAVGVWLSWPRTAITRENAEKVQVGMTLGEVEAILGGPPREEPTGPLRADGPAEQARGETARALASGNDAEAAAEFFRDMPYQSGAYNRRVWVSDRVIIAVHLDGTTGRVVSCDSLPVRGIGPLDRLRRWLGL
jgi:hypothetical protein